jgi:hypothetical protein
MVGNDPVGSWDWNGFIPYKEAIKYLENNVKKMAKDTKCNCALLRAMLSAIYVELRRQTTKDKWVDSSASFMYVKLGFTGNSYGPAQIKPEFAEKVIKSNKILFKNIINIKETEKRRQKIYNEIINKPWIFVAAGMQQMITQWKTAKKRNPAIADISNNPGILATLYNLGFSKSNPKSNPKLGGSRIKMDGKTKTFGEWAKSFSESQAMQDLLKVVGCE